MDEKETNRWKWKCLYTYCELQYLGGTSTYHEFDLFSTANIKCKSSSIVVLRSSYVVMYRHVVKPC